MLLFADSFDHYATADLLKKWPLSSGSSTVILPTGGRRGGGALQTTGNVNYAMRGLGANYSTLIAGVAISPSTTAADRRLLTFYDGSTAQVSVAYTSTGTLKVFRGTISGGTLLGTTTATIPTSAYSYLEAKVVFHASTGSVVLRANGVQILSLTGLNTSASTNAYSNGVMLGESISVAFHTCAFDDFYLLDPLSGSQNVDFLGDVRVDCLVPASDGAYSSFNSSVVGRSARYWRVYVTAVQGGVANAGAYEIEFRSASGGADQCTGGSASSSAGTPANAFDDNATTFWNSSTPLPQWIAYDFGAGVTKEIVEISWKATSTPTAAPIAFEMQYSDDGTTWYRAFDCTSPPTWTAGETRVFARPADAKYWQVDDLGGIATDNVYSNTPGNRQTFGFQDLASTTGTVYGVQSVAAVTKDDAGTRAAKLLAKSGGTLASSAANALGTSVSMVSQIVETDPATGAAWTPSGINTAEFGVEVA